MNKSTWCQLVSIGFILSSLLLPTSVKAQTGCKTVYINGEEWCNFGVSDKTRQRILAQPDSVTKISVDAVEFVYRADWRQHQASVVCIGHGARRFYLPYGHDEIEATSPATQSMLKYVCTKAGFPAQSQSATSSCDMIYFNGLSWCRQGRARTGESILVNPNSVHRLGSAKAEFLYMAGRRQQRASTDCVGGNAGRVYYSYDQHRVIRADSPATRSMLDYVCSEAGF